MTFSRLEFCMYSFMRQVKKERPGFISFFHPFNGIIREYVCNVTSFRLFYPFAINIKGRIIINTLAPETDPVIKTRLWPIIGIAHMPFSHKGSLITLVPQIRREENKIGW